MAGKQVTTPNPYWNHTTLIFKLLVSQSHGKPHHPHWANQPDSPTTIFTFYRSSAYNPICLRPSIFRTRASNSQPQTWLHHKSPPKHYSSPPHPYAPPASQRRPPTPSLPITQHPDVPCPQRFGNGGTAQKLQYVSWLVRPRIDSQHPVSTHPQSCAKQNIYSKMCMRCRWWTLVSEDFMNHIISSRLSARHELLLLLLLSILPAPPPALEWPFLYAVIII